MDHVVMGNIEEELHDKLKEWTNDYFSYFLTYDSRICLDMDVLALKSYPEFLELCKLYYKMIKETPNSAKTYYDSCQGYKGYNHFSQLSPSFINEIEGGHFYSYYIVFNEFMQMLHVLHNINLWNPYKTAGTNLEETDKMFFRKVFMWVFELAVGKIEK